MCFNQFQTDDNIAEKGCAGGLNIINLVDEGDLLTFCIPAYPWAAKSVLKVTDCSTGNKSAFPFKDWFFL